MFTKMEFNSTLFESNIKATLIYWAKLDNETEFHKIKEESLSELVDRSVKEG